MMARVNVMTTPINATTTTTQCHHHHHQQQPQKQRQYRRCRQQKISPLHYALLLLCVVHARASPAPVAISSPEIANKSGKTTSGGGGASPTATLFIKSNAQDAQLNSLSAYAANYDNISPISSNAPQMQTPNFKPSYKLPDMESNFTPLQSNGGQHYHHYAQLPPATPLTTGAAPVYMQYLPSAPFSDGNSGGGGGGSSVQYLQLVQTRPLIVPISPYLSANAPANVAQPATAYHPPLSAAVNPGAVDYAARAPAVLTPLLANSNNLPPPPALPHLVNVQGAGAASPYGLHTYASGMQQPFRSSFRINREVKSKPFGGALNLNLNEYVPAPNEQMRPLVYMRGRP